MTSKNASKKKRTERPDGYWQDADGNLYIDATDYEVIGTAKELEDDAEFERLLAIINGDVTEADDTGDGTMQWAESDDEDQDQEHTPTTVEDFIKARRDGYEPAAPAPTAGMEQAIQQERRRRTNPSNGTTSPEMAAYLAQKAEAEAQEAQEREARAAALHAAANPPRGAARTGIHPDYAARMESARIEHEAYRQSQAEEFDQRNEELNARREAQAAQDEEVREQIEALRKQRREAEKKNRATSTRGRV